MINDRVLVLVESVEGVDALDAIVVSDPGPDLVIVGRTDLAAALGVPGQRHHELVEGQVDRVVERLDGSTDRPVIAGIQVHGPADLVGWRDRGSSFLSIASDTAILPRACNGVAASLR